MSVELYECRIFDRGKGKLTFKEVILQVSAIKPICIILSLDGYDYGGVGGVDCGYDNGDNNDDNDYGDDDAVDDDYDDDGRRGWRGFAGVMKYFRHILMGHELFLKIFDWAQKIFLCFPFLIFI